MDLYSTFFVRGRTIRFPATIYMDSLTFGLGRAQITLDTSGFDTQFPPAVEEQLYRELVSRALAARGSYPAVTG